MAVFSCSAIAQTPPVSIPTQDFGPVWTGFYVGAAFGAGGQVNRLNTSGGGVNSTFDGAGQSGVLGSIYGGVDYQITRRGIVGLLGELSYAGLQGAMSAQVPGASANVNMNSGFGWAVLARAGFLASPSTLLYLAGGYTGQSVYTSASASVPGAFATASGNATLNGWTVGPGFETMLTNNLSARLEYRYSQYGATTLPGTGIGWSPSTHAMRAGLSYKFGGLSSSESFGSTRQPDTDWTGIYGGVAGGGGMGFGSLAAVAAPGVFSSVNPGGAGLLGGFFVGADWQFMPRALVGVMADFTWQDIQSTASLSTPVGNAYATLDANRQWSVMGRIGWLPVPSTLIYALAGYSQLNVQATATAAALGGTAYVQSDNAFSGFTVGPGIEAVVTGGWTTRLEYRYSQYETKQVLSGITAQPETHTIRAGLSYKFGIGGSTSTARADD
jgi:outer membrane immunogenic protein